MRPIGEVAAATRLTVRTLRHYDEIGLLAASQRSAATRATAFYSDAGARRLYRSWPSGAASGLFLQAIEAMTMAEQYYTPAGVSGGPLERPSR